jgi:FtsZ-binding cell division protein ZapB
MESNQQIFNHLIGDITSLKAEIETLKAENETLKESVYDPYGSNQTCAEILRHYRDEMDIIQKLDDDDWMLEDISCVAPYIETLKAENEKLKENVVDDCAIMNANIMLSFLAHLFGYRHLHNPLDPNTVVGKPNTCLSVEDRVGDMPVFDFIRGVRREVNDFYIALWIRMGKLQIIKPITKTIYDDNFYDTIAENVPFDL